MNKWMVQIFLYAFVTLLLVPMAIAGQWIEHSLDSYNWDQFAVGSEGVGIAEPTSNSLLFFNARTGVWTEHNLDTPMSVVNVLADGFLVLVVGEERAVVFNTMNSTISELDFEGGSLFPSDSNSRSYDCGRELAMIVTDQEFCVFDAEMDQWRRHAYSLMGSPLTTFRHQCHDYYAASFMYQTDTENMLNIVYSLLLHDFNETSQGLDCPIEPMAHGYAGLRTIYQGDSYLVGYSAVTNSFDHVFVPNGMEAGGTFNNGNAETIGIKTVFVGYLGDNSITDIRDYHTYGYDTRHGSWQYQLITTVSGESSLGSWNSGGTFCSNRVHHSESGIDDLLVFDGTSNSFQMSLLSWERQGSLLGGNVMMCTESERVVGVDVESGEHDSSNHPYYGRPFPGLNYISYLSEGPGEDAMTVNIYNGNHNTWHHHETGPLDHEGWGTEHVQIRKSGAPQEEVIFYSAYRDEIYTMSLAGWPSASPLITDNYAGFFRASDGLIAFYDAHRGSGYSWSGFDSLTGGERYVMTLDSTTLEAKAYSLATGMWSFQTLENDGVLHGGLDLIGLAKSSNGYVYNVFYAFDATANNWAVLHPSGVYVALCAGQRTALYLSTYNAYALGTGNITSVERNLLSLQGGSGAVDVRWEGGLDLTAEEVRLTARGPNGSSAPSWNVAMVREGCNHFRALDNCPNLSQGGLFTYTIEVTTSDGQGVILATDTIHLQPAPLAAIRHIHPNPFNPNTSIDFFLAIPMDVELCVYDLAGRKVRVLVQEMLEAGSCSVPWDGCDDSGRPMASGMYSVRLQTETVTDLQKMMLVR